MSEMVSVVVVEVLRLFILALFLERGLAVVFDSRPWKKWLDGHGLSPFVAFAVAVAVTTTWRLDVFSVVAAVGGPVLDQRPYTEEGAVLTALVIAGGSKVILALAERVREARERLAP